MLRASALQYGRSWDKSLPYAEFSYNNSYQESLNMAPFEMLYGHRYYPHCFGVRLENGRFSDPTQHIARSQEACLHGEREPVSCAV
jgi:hypothetical protein